MPTKADRAQQRKQPKKAPPKQVRKLSELADVDLVDEVEAAAVLLISTSTLQKQRVRGDGPKFTLIGRLVRYTGGNIRAYIKERTVASTSQRPAILDGMSRAAEEAKTDGLI